MQPTALGTIRIAFLTHELTPGGNTVRFLFDITDGGSDDDRITIWIDSSGYVNALMKSTEGENTQITGALNVLDGRIHRVQVSWRTGDFNLSVDGSDGAYAAVSAVPDDLDRIDVGQNRTAATQLNGIIADVDTSAKYTPKMLREWG